MVGAAASRSASDSCAIAGVGAAAVGAATVGPAGGGCVRLIAVAELCLTSFVAGGEGEPVRASELTIAVDATVKVPIACLAGLPPSAKDSPAVATGLAVASPPAAAGLAAAASTAVSAC